jgi:hypothetical protein
MIQPRYQIFVSSTFKDLQEERQAVLNAILKLNQFPAGMEIFPAVNDTAWEHIEKVIEVSDYYVLIIGGKYGSIEAESGISYTEKEYDFAVSKNIPVLAFTRSDEDSIPVGKAEMNEEIREKLKYFKQKVGNRHHWNYWKTLEELKANVVTSLAMSFATNPQKGWEKAAGIEKVELLERLADLQQKYDNLVEENLKLKEYAITFESEQFAFGFSKIKIDFNYRGSSKIWQCETSWNDLFFTIGKLAVTGFDEWEIKSSVSHSILGYFEDTEDFNVLSDAIQSSPIEEGEYKITNECFETIRNQFLALKLIDISASTFTEGNKISNHFFTSTEVIRMWELTEKGRQIYLSKIAIRDNQTI